MSCVEAADEQAASSKGTNKRIAQRIPLPHPFIVVEPREGLMVTPTVRLSRRLGVGGMGSVWLADHQALKTSVVVKFIASEFANDANALSRFAREAAAASQVKSPHVVKMLDHGVSDDGTPYIVMEHLEGHADGVQRRASEERRCVVREGVCTRSVSAFFDSEGARRSARDGGARRGPRGDFRDDRLGHALALPDAAVGYIDRNAFPTAHPAPYWTSSTRNLEAWSVDFNSGSPKTESTSDLRFHRCVRLAP